MFAALYNGYLYGLSCLFNDAFNLVFGKMGYSFNTVGVGLCFLGLVVGFTLGPIVSILQERHYQKAMKFASDEPEERLNNNQIADLFKNIPAARLQLGKIAAITFPVSLFWFAWTSPP